MAFNLALLYGLIGPVALQVIENQFRGNKVLADMDVEFLQILEVQYLQDKSDVFSLQDGGWQLVPKNFLEQNILTRLLGEF